MKSSIRIKKLHAIILGTLLKAELEDLGMMMISSSQIALAGNVKRLYAGREFCTVVESFRFARLA